MKYELTDPQTGQKTMKKWKILASVMPHVLTRGNNQYDERYMSRHKRKEFKRQWAQLEEMKKEDRDFSQFMDRIQCTKRICDIGSFCKFFTADNKGYNVVTKNCQQFAAKLFAFLLQGDAYKE